MKSPRRRFLQLASAEGAGPVLSQITLALLLAAVASIAAVVLTPPQASAELLSSRPITVVIPYTPGASSDTFQRLVAKRVSEDTGQQVIVESRPGGGGAVGAGGSSMRRRTATPCFRRTLPPTVPT